MRLLARWTLLSALGAPLALLIGLCLGASRQAAHFDSRVDTISALAAHGAEARWIMTCALVVLGFCHVATAAGLWLADKRGRAVLGLGGLATVAVAALPLPAQGSSSAHLTVAALAFAALSAWPWLAARTTDAPVTLSRPVSRAVSLLLFVLLAGFVLALTVDAYVGASERVVAMAQALWPLCVVLDARRRA